MIDAWAALGFGIALLWFGAGQLVTGASALALRAGLTRLTVGLTVVAYGTSAPELVVSVDGAFAGLPAVAVGNVVGSNIANLALILALTALVNPVGVSSDVLRRDLPVMVVATLAFAGLLGVGMGRAAGIASLVAFVAYTAWTLRGSGSASSEEVDDGSVTGIEAVVRIAVGLALLVGGSRALIAGAVDLAAAWGVPEAVVALTLVAVGTSLPELATSLLAAARGESDLAVGNVVGSNIANLLGILGVVAVLAPIPAVAVPVEDLVVMAAVAVVVAPMLWTGRVLGRPEGSALLAVYAGYIASLALRAG